MPASRPPFTRAGAAANVAAVGWYGADVTEEMLVWTVKFDSYGRLGQYPGTKSTEK
jgi:hypothetical protein